LTISHKTACIHIAFVELLLPLLQIYVNLKMKVFFLKLFPSQVHMSAEKGAQRKAKKKKSKKKIETDPLRVLQLQLPRKKAKKERHKLVNHSELAKLYLSQLQLVNFTSLEECSDVRILLTIMAEAKSMPEAECFTDEEVDLAGKLKASFNDTAHTQISKFTKQYTLDVLDNLEKLFQIIPEDTQNLKQVKRDLQQVKKYGCQALLQNRSGQEITALKKSLEGVLPSLKATIEATLRGEEDKLKDIEVVERKMGGLWQKLPPVDEIVCTELELVSQKGNASSLQSIISTNKPKTKSTDVFGYEFKVAKDPFSKGTTRLAYRGHFEFNLVQLSDYFRDSPEVVVKVSSEDATTYQKVHIYAHAFAEEWNKMREQKEISFSWILSVKLPGFEGTQTIEPYLNRKQYKKWSNNDGFAPVKENYEPIPDAFSHWTYEVSKGQMMVVDLQGVKEKGVFLLTDPAIHSAIGDFGRDNKRAMGIAKFFESHVCNSFCEQLKLTKQK